MIEVIVEVRDDMEPVIVKSHGVVILKSPRVASSSLPSPLITHEPII